MIARTYAVISLAIATLFAVPVGIFGGVAAGIITFVIAGAITWFALSLCYVSGRCQ